MSGGAATDKAVYPADAMDLSKWDEAPSVCLLGDGQDFLAYFPFSSQ